MTEKCVKIGSENWRKLSQDTVTAVVTALVSACSLCLINSSMEMVEPELGSIGDETAGSGWSQLRREVRGNAAQPFYTRRLPSTRTCFVISSCCITVLLLPIGALHFMLYVGHELSPESFTALAVSLFRAINSLASHA